jgi:hypothetical protein
MCARRLLFVAALLAVALLTGCAAATPQLIGSYPRNPAPTAYFPLDRAYSTALHIRVADVDAAARSATQLAGAAGGYLQGSQSWYQDGSLVTSLTLAVPASRFTDLRAALASLGQLLDEQLTSAPAYPYSAAALQATIIVTLTSRGAPASPPAPPAWALSPAQTFAQAFAVFSLIFTVLVDVLIWVSVVAGPFVLVGLGLRWLVRRYRRPTRQP